MHQHIRGLTCAGSLHAKTNYLAKSLPFGLSLCCKISCQANLAGTNKYWSPETLLHSSLIKSKASKTRRLWTKKNLMLLQAAAQVAVQSAENVPQELDYALIAPGAKASLLSAKGWTLCIHWVVGIFALWIKFLQHIITQTASTRWSGCSIWGSNIPSF